MKRKFIITILWLLWIASMIGMVFGVDSYIDSKRVKLRSRIRHAVESIFEGQSGEGVFVSMQDGFFDVDYSGSPVRHYKKVAIPSKPRNEGLLASEPGWYEEAVDNWEQTYGDLASLYELNWGDEYPNHEDDGWTIIRIHGGNMDEDIIQTNLIFPYKVGLTKNIWGNYYTVEQAVNDAFEFYTSDPKSGYSDRFSKGSKSRIWSKIYDSDNEYYSIVENRNHNGQLVCAPICQPKDKSYFEAQQTMPFENGWMYNNYCKVFIAATQEKHYRIEEKDWAVNENRNNLLLWYGIGLIVLFLSLIIPLTIKECKVNKRKSESLYQRLCRMCNPSNFIKDYNKEKVDKANDIYRRLMEINPDDNDALMTLQAEAVANLGIVLIDAEKLKDLTEKVNPQRFMNPYNAEKVKIANDLYSRLTKAGLTYEEFAQIEEESKTL